MIDFIQVQWDYFVFLQGFVWIAFGAAALNIRHIPRHSSFLRLGQFGLLFGSHIWLAFLTDGVSASLFMWIQLALLILSCLALLEFVRIELGSRVRPATLRNVRVILIGVASLGILGGKPLLDISCGLALGLSGGVLASWALLNLRPGQDKSARTALVQLSIAMTANALLVCLTSPAIDMYFARFPNDARIVALIHGCVQLIHILIAILGLAALVRYNRALEPLSGNRLMRRVVPLALTFLIALGWFTADRRGVNTDQMMRQTLLHQAIGIAETILPSGARELSFTAADKGQPAFERIRRQMIAHGKTIHQWSIYSMALRDGQIFFGPENLDEDDPLASPPGTLYEQPGPEDLMVFQNRKPYVIGPQTDEYGSFVTAIAPVIDSETNSVPMVVGLDVPLREWMAKIRVARRAPILASLALSLILLAGGSCLQWRQRLPVEARHVWRHIEAAMIAVFGLAISATVTFFVVETECREHRNIFLQLTGSFAESIRDEFIALKSNISSVARFYEGSQFVDRAEFHEFVEPMVHDSGFRAIEWVPQVPQSELQAFQDKARNEGLDGFTIHEPDPQGGKIPVGPQAVYFPVYYVEPLSENESVLGLDLAAEMLGRDALNSAIDTRLATATEPIALVRGTDGPSDILVFQPIYSPSNPDSLLPSAVPNPFRGLAVGVIRMQDLLDRSVSSNYETDAIGLAFDLIDLTNSQNPILLASYPPGHVERQGNILQAPALDLYGPINIHPLFFFGRSYGIVTHTESAFSGSHRFYSGWIAGGAGLLLTAILTLVVAFLQNRRADLENQISQRTAELKESEAAYKALYDQSHLNEQRLETMFRLNQMADESLNILCQFAMEEAVRLTGSTIGYLAFVNEDETVLTMHAWSRLAMQECRIKDKPILYPVEKSGLWGEVIRQRKPVITNDYSQPNPLKKGFPEGHVSIRRHMNAPIFDGSRIVIVAGVGNKATGYDETDVRQLTLLMQGMWSILRRKQAEESLRKSEQRYRTIVEHLNDALYIHDFDGILLDVNDNTCKLLGYTREELIGSHLSRFDGPENARRIAEHMKLLMDTGRLEFDGEHIRKDGTLVPTTVSARVVSWEGRGIAQSFVRDITERKRAEDKLRKTMEAANAANVAKSQFLANMSHEIRTPMNAILGFAELLAQDKLTPQQSDFVRTIRSSGSHLLDLINDILDFSKIEAGKMTLEFTECSLGTLLSELESLMAPFAQTKGLRFEMIKPTVLPRVVLTDPVRLRQCLVNLVNNAIKFTETGYVIVRTLVLGTETLPVLRFEVEDTGPGIDSAAQHKIFEAFEQADGSMTRKYGGTGLGLTITRHLARLFGGSLQLTSQVGKGSTFILEIPVTADRRKRPRQSERDLPNSGELSESLPHRFQGRILVAEDVKTNQELVRILLNQVGLQPVIVEDGQVAVEQVLRQEFDLILLDMQMPRLSGFEVARTLRKQGIRTPIVALTAGAIKGDEQKCLEAGCDEYLTKPIDRMKLLQVLAQYLPAATCLNHPA